jgi:hypothetical protein
MFSPIEIRHQITAQIVEALSNGNVPHWRRSWPSRRIAGRPMTPMYTLAFRQSGVAWTSCPGCSYWE